LIIFVLLAVAAAEHIMHLMQSAAVVAELAVLEPALAYQ
jgi:hypothetical protein